MKTTKLNKPDPDLVEEFLRQSNLIENEPSEEAYQDAQKAWDYAWKHRHQIDEYYIFDIHRLLLERLNPRIAGRFRGCDIWIGGKKKKYISVYTLKEQLSSWLKVFADVGMVHNPPRPPESYEDAIREAHVQFEGVHPFEDGNGRTGRILYNIQRLKAGLPLHIIHVGEEQMEYYKWFENV